MQNEIVEMERREREKTSVRRERLWFWMNLVNVWIWIAALLMMSHLAFCR